MSSIWATWIGPYILRCGPQAGTSVLLCSRQAHHACVPSYNGTLHQCPSSEMSTPKKQKLQWSKRVTDNSTELDLAESYKSSRRFITDPGLINSILENLAPWGSSRMAPIIMECNPGPGILTRALLDAGHKVFALESSLAFLPSLKKLQKTAGGQLQVVHCDFFRIDPWFERVVQPPSMHSFTLMKSLNIREHSWASDVPLKVFLMLDYKKERIFFWQQIYHLYEQLSMYRYGRIELNVFMMENQYSRLISNPGDFKNYQALSVLYQVACDIELLHKEPKSTFFLPSKFRRSATTKSRDCPDNLCLVRITPRRRLFSEDFTPANGKTFIYLIKQFLAKRKSLLLHKLDNLTPGNGKDLLQSLALPMDVATGCIYPEKYKLLFEILLRSEEFNWSLLSDNMYNNIAVPCYSIDQFHCVQY